MMRSGQTPVVSKRIKVETKRRWPLLSPWKAPMMGDEEKSMSKNSISQDLRGLLALPNEVLVIILRYVFGQRPRAFLCGRDPTFLHFVGNLSILDTNTRMRLTALPILLQNIDVIGHDLLAPEIRGLSPMYYDAVSALTIGWEDLDLFGTLWLGEKLFTGLSSVHLKLELQLPDRFSYQALGSRNPSPLIFAWLGRKAHTIRYLLEKYNGDMMPKLTVQITMSRGDNLAAVALIKDRIMYVDGQGYHKLLQERIVFLLCEALNMWYFTLNKGELVHRVWNPVRGGYIGEVYLDSSVLSWAEMLWSL